MGPRSHERGNPLAHPIAVLRTQFLASMGPRSHERGNTTDCIDRTNRLRGQSFNGAAFS